MEQNIRAVASRIPKQPPLPSVVNFRYEGSRFWFGPKDEDWYMTAISSSEITGIIVCVDGLVIKTKTITEVWKNTNCEGDPYSFLYDYES